MKHHKVKGVWKHRPDALPLPDAPSTGARKKKGPLEKASTKHLWDLAKQRVKDIRLHFRWVRYNPSFMLDGNLQWIIRDCNNLDSVLLELERRRVLNE